MRRLARAIRQGSERSSFASIVVVAVGACSARAPGLETGTDAPVHEQLPRGVVARVGPIELRDDEVARIAATQGIEPPQAVERAVRDARLAQAASQAAYDQRPSVRVALRGQLARATLVDLRAGVEEPSPTDAEVDEATQRHFFDLDRPDAFRVIHAVVRLPEKADPATKARVRAVAERLLHAESDVSSAEAFRTRAQSVDASGFEVLVQELLPVAADGRVIDIDHPPAPKQEPGHYVPAFAHAAARLSEIGQKSGVVETEFGFHVLMLLERQPGHTVPLEERRASLKDEILALRAKKSIDDHVRALRAGHPTAIDRGADALIRSLDISKP